jgi:CRISPR-associated protein Csy1
MAEPDLQRTAQVRALISDFLHQRLADKLDKLAPDDPKRPELQAQFIPAVWLADAARRAGQIQAVTHSLKPIHPDAKGTSLYAPPATLPKLSVVGSHCLGPDFAGDVVGNAAALDVYKFLKLEHAGQTLLTLAQAGDPDLAAALSPDPAQAGEWMQAFADLTAPRGRVASHTQAKQLYWLTSTDPHDDTAYHLLAPLYASSLAHKVYLTLQDDRFGDAAKAARAARKAKQYSSTPIHDYPEMAVQQLGGTKPQNISQLNSERRGNNHLLASLPPVWRSIPIKPLLHSESMFPRYSRRDEVKAALGELRAFLKTDPTRNVTTRQRRAAWVDELIDEFLQFRAELASLPLGWSQTPDCRLSDAEARWLDPTGCAQADAQWDRPAPTDVAERISAAFANWLNAQMRPPLPMGDPEFAEWRKTMLAQIQAEEREGRDADE